MQYVFKKKKVIHDSSVENEFRLPPLQSSNLENQFIMICVASSEHIETIIKEEQDSVRSIFFMQLS